MAGYQAANLITITRTADGQLVTFVPDYETKTVAVVIASETVGTWRNWTAAKVELGLIDETVVKPPKRRRKEVQPSIS